MIILEKAHLGGLISGLAVSYIVLNKFQQSVGQDVLRKTGEHTNITYDDIRCFNCKNFKTAYLYNPDLIKLLTGKKGLIRSEEIKNNDIEPLFKILYFIFAS